MIVEDTGGSFERCPAGVQLARCYRIVDLGTQKTDWQGQTKYLHKIMHVLFVTYAHHDNCDLVCEKFTGDKVDAVEESAKIWLYENVSHWLYSSVVDGKSKEEIKQMFMEPTFVYLVQFVHDNSYVHIQKIYYHHD